MTKKKKKRKRTKKVFTEEYILSSNSGDDQKVFNANKLESSPLQFSAHIYVAWNFIKSDVQVKLFGGVI